MMIQKTFRHPVTGGPLKMGRSRPAHDAQRRRLRLGDYIRRALPPPPASTAYSPLAQPCLDQLLLNDRLSDCTTATAMHIAGLLLGNAGVPVRFANAQAEAFYALSTGYVPGRPATDRGGDERTVLDCWRTHGLEKGLHAIAGDLAVDAGNPDEVRHALHLFGNLYFGVELPDAWLRARPRTVLDVAGSPVEENGHAFAGLRYDADGVEVLLWGGIQCLLPYAGLARYATAATGGELHAVISRDSIAKASARAPNGLAWADLAADFAAMGGHLA